MSETKKEVVQGSVLFQMFLLFQNAICLHVLLRRSEIYVNVYLTCHFLKFPVHMVPQNSGLDPFIGDVALVQAPFSVSPSAAAQWSGAQKMDELSHRGLLRRSHLI